MGSCPHGRKRNEARRQLRHVQVCHQPIFSQMNPKAGCKKYTRLETVAQVGRLPPSHG